MNTNAIYTPENNSTISESVRTEEYYRTTIDGIQFQIYFQQIGNIKYYQIIDKRGCSGHEPIVHDPKQPIDYLLFPRAQYSRCRKYGHGIEQTRLVENHSNMPFAAFQVDPLFFLRCKIGIDTAYNFH